MALCDICNAPGKGTVVKASDMSNAVCKGFDPFKEGLMNGNVGLMAAGNSGILFPEAWRQSAISGRLSMSDWNICDRCMNKLRPHLLEESFIKCRRCGRNQIQITSEYYCIKCDKSYWWSVYGTFLILAIASIMVGVFQCNPGFWRWFWIVIGALAIFGFSHDFWKFYRGNLLGSTNSRTDTKIKQKQNVTFSSSGELESYTAVSTPQNSQPIDQADYLMDYEKGSIPIGDLPIGARAMVNLKGENASKLNDMQEQAHGLWLSGPDFDRAFNSLFADLVNDDPDIRAEASRLLADARNALQKLISIYQECLHSDPQRASLAGRVLGRKLAKGSDDMIHAENALIMYGFSASFIPCPCVHCGYFNRGIAAPPGGPMVPYYHQSDDKGAYAVPVLCDKCGKEFFVVWDTDPFGSSMQF